MNGLWREDFNLFDRLNIKTDVNVNGIDYVVSTVDLGLDHSFGEGDPLYFETMVFHKGDYLDLYMNRYSTEEEAKEGHNKTVEMLKDGTLELYEDTFSHWLMDEKNN